MINKPSLTLDDAKQLLAAAGGSPIIVDGHLVGAMGVSGVKAVEDEQIAMHAIETVFSDAATARAGEEGDAGPDRLADESIVASMRSFAWSDTAASAWVGESSGVLTVSSGAFPASAVSGGLAGSSTV